MRHAAWQPYIHCCMQASVHTVLVALYSLSCRTQLPRAPIFRRSPTHPQNKTTTPQTHAPQVFKDKSARDDAPPPAASVRDRYGDAQGKLFDTERGGAAERGRDEEVWRLGGGRH